MLHSNKRKPALLKIYPQMCDQFHGLHVLLISLLEVYEVSLRQERWHHKTIVYVTPNIAIQRIDV